MAHMNLATFNPFNGLTAGIPLSVGVSNPMRPGRTYPSHLRCGDGFIAVERAWQHPHMEGGKLMSATLALREPAGQRPFLVFDRHTETEERFFLFFDNTAPTNVKLRHDPNQVNSWQGARTIDYSGTSSGTFEVVLGDGFSGNCFIAAAPGDTVYVYTANGAVYAFACRDDGFSVMPLSLREMARLRVEQFEEQIHSLDLHDEPDVRRLHGIIGGCVRLLSLGRKNAEVREVFVNFLTEWAGKMTVRQRAEIRMLLLDARDPQAGNFIEGWSGVSVVLLDSFRPTGTGKTKVERDRLKAERAAKDRARREEMRGKTGGRTEPRTNPEMAARRARKHGNRR